MIWLSHSRFARSANNLPFYFTIIWKIYLKTKFSIFMVSSLEMAQMGKGLTWLRSYIWTIGPLKYIIFYVASLLVYNYIFMADYTF